MMELYNHIINIARVVERILSIVTKPTYTYLIKLYTREEIKKTKWAPRVDIIIL